MNTMNLGKLYAIVNSTTRQFRKGDPIEERQDGALLMTDVFLMPHVDEARKEHPEYVFVDMIFVWVAVDKALAETMKADLIEVLATYPNVARLAAGPSYIEVGGVVGDQGVALQLFALGHVLGLWKLITPVDLHVTGSLVREMAGRGYLMISPYKVDAHEQA